MSINFIIKRCISTTCVNYGKRNFRKFPLYNKRGSRQFKEAQTNINTRDPNLFHSEFGLVWIQKLPLLMQIFSIARGVREVGYYERNGKFILIPEKIPEFIVPDLTDCEVVNHWFLCSTWLKTPLNIFS